MNQVADQPKPTTQLITELDLGSSQRRPASQAAELQIAITRPLVDADLTAIQNPPASAAPQTPQGLVHLRHTHHNLARLVAEGKSPTEAAVLSGYSAGYIGSLQNDPAFAELVHYYSIQKETLFVDALARLRAIGIDAAEKLQELMSTKTDWSARELMEVIEMTIVKPATAKMVAQAGVGRPAGGGVVLNLDVNFVGVKPAGPPTLEAKFSDITPE